MGGSPAITNETHRTDKAWMFKIAKISWNPARDLTRCAESTATIICLFCSASSSSRCATNSMARRGSRFWDDAPRRDASRGASHPAPNSSLTKDRVTSSWVDVGRAAPSHLRSVLLPVPHTPLITMRWGDSVVQNKCRRSRLCRRAGVINRLPEGTSRRNTAVSAFQNLR